MYNPWKICIYNVYPIYNIVGNKYTISYSIISKNRAQHGIEWHALLHFHIIVEIMGIVLLMNIKTETL